MSAGRLKEVKEPPKADGLFRLDIKGDRLNLAYECLPPASIPKYRTAGRGNAIGLHRGFRILKEHGTRRKVVATGLDSAIKQRHSASTTEQPSPLFVRGISQQIDTITGQDDYVAVDDSFSRKRRPLSRNNETRGSDESDSAESATQYTPRVSEGDSSSIFKDGVHLRQRALAETTSSDPANIEAWLALIDLQTDIVRSPGDPDGRLTASQQRIARDLKISFYQDAIAKVGNSKSKERLVTGLMKEGSKVWDRGRQVSEWRALMKMDPSFELSLLYLDFVQTNHNAFSHDHCVQEFYKCLSAQMKRPPGSDRDRCCLYLLLRLTRFLQESGFTERATAIWQALLELNLYGLSETSPAGQELKSLEDFWDSEAPRVGEVGWVLGSAQFQESKEDPEILRIDPMDILNSWSVAEETAASHTSLPARTLDTTFADDAFRVVMFSDVQDFVFQVSLHESLQLLLDALLCFGGLPCISGTPASFGWRNDPFLYPASRAPPTSTAADTILVPMPFTGVSDLSTLFASADVFNAFSTRHAGPQQPLWYHRAVEQIALTRSEDEALGTYAIALALQKDLTAARKLARRLIKGNSTSLKLYNAYALVEAYVGNEDAADNVWRSALAIDPTLAMAKESNTMQLWRSWIFNVVLHGKLQKALGLLRTLSMDAQSCDSKPHRDTEGDNASARAENVLQTVLTQRLSQPDEMSVISTELLAIFRYCRASGNLDPALQTYRTVLTILEEADNRQSETVEALHQRRSQLVHLHISSGRGNFEPKKILATLSESVTAFPSNSIFMTVHSQYQRKYGFMDRLREVATGTLSNQQDNLFSYMININKEMAGRDQLGSTEHSIRAAFTSANDVDSPVCYCPAIRLAHVRWEISVLQQRPKTLSISKKRDKKLVALAVDAFFDALRACPWVKEIYMLAFKVKTMREALGSSRLKEIYETLLDRGLRVHVDISDMIEHLPT